MRVDIHAHCFPARYLDALERLGGPPTGAVRALGAGDMVADVDARIGLMDGAGVDLQVLSLSSLGPALPEPGQAAEAARLGNDLYAELIGARPMRLAAFAAVPLPHVDAALEEIDRVLREPAFLGVAVTTGVLGRSIADPAFEPLFAELDRRASVLFVHPAGRGAESPLIVDAGLTWPIGAPIEDTVSVTHLVARGIPARYPHLRIVNAHLGGALPMLLGRLDHQYPRAFPDGPEAPSASARRMWYDTVAHGHLPALVAAHASYGAGRLVLGTDFPYVRGDRYQESIEDVAAAGLPPAEASAILDETAAAVLGLGAA